ncbi:MAG: ABC transporter ATP-binding protein [Oligoflexia bacterium]|nr:ABC transporter ATP-binding protein [Oligoflexia bacterium]
MKKNDVAIEIRGLSKNFHDKAAVINLDLDVCYGEITALLGSNGAGKTTTINMIVGFLQATEGKISISGLNLQEEKNHLKVKNLLGHMGTEMALYEKFSVKESWELFASLRKIEKKSFKKRIDYLMELFEIDGFQNKRYNELSSGQKQKSLIVATVLHDPPILIFDEVTASLDVITSRSIMDFIKMERSRGKAILFSTHILSEVEYLCDKVAILHEGKLRDVTNPQELMKKHQVSNMTDAFYYAIKNYKGE